MANIRIPGLVAKASKRAGTSWYWQPSATLARAGWTPMPLGKDEGAAIAAARARNAQVAAWKAGELAAPNLPVKPRVQPATVSALVARYRREVVQALDPATGQPRVRARTGEGYETSLKRIEQWAGPHPLAFVTPARVRALRDAVARPREAGGLGHAPALALLKTLRQVFAFAERVDLIAKGSNPARGFDLGAVPSRHQLWEPDDEAAFIAAANDLGRPGLALACELALYTSQRAGDLIAWTEAQLAPLAIRDAGTRALFARPDGSVLGWTFAQRKTSTAYARRTMEIPLTPALAARVEAALRDNRARDRKLEPPRLLSHVLVDDRQGGRPWQARDFHKAWRAVIEHAVQRTGRTAMRDLVWHDLRRTRVVRMLTSGIDPATVAMLTGHDPKSIAMMISVYGPISPARTAAALAATLRSPATLPTSPAETRNVG